MADIVNLRRVRKTRARIARDAEAAANRAAFGMTNTARRAASDTAAKRDALLDGAKRDTPE